MASSQDLDDFEPDDWATQQWLELICDDPLAFSHTTAHMTAAFPLTQPPSLTPDDVLDRLSAAIERKAAAEQEISNCKEVLTLMRAEGLINDSVESDDLKPHLDNTLNLAILNAVKSLQDMEKIEGIATKKQSSSWTAKQLNPKF